MALDEGGLADTAVSDHDQLELGCEVFVLLHLIRYYIILSPNIKDPTTFSERTDPCLPSAPAIPRPLETAYWSSVVVVARRRISLGYRLSAITGIDPNPRAARLGLAVSAAGTVKRVKI